MASNTIIIIFVFVFLTTTIKITITIDKIISISTAKIGQQMHLQTTETEFCSQTVSAIPFLSSQLFSLHSAHIFKSQVSPPLHPRQKKKKTKSQKYVCKLNGKTID